MKNVQFVNVPSCSCSDEKHFKAKHVHFKLFGFLFQASKKKGSRRFSLVAQLKSDGRPVVRVLPACFQTCFSV